MVGTFEVTLECVANARCLFACVKTALPPTPNNIACEQLSGHVGQNCLFLSLCPDPSLSSTLHGVRMVWWSTEDWEISDDDWPSAGLWSVTAAITSARHHCAAAASQPSLLELIYMWSVDPSHTYSSKSHISFAISSVYNLHTHRGTFVLLFISLQSQLGHLAWSFELTHAILLICLSVC